MVQSAVGDNQQVSHVILDLDGVLIDTERAYNTANERTMAQFGAKFTRELKVMMMGRKKTEAMGVLLKSSGLAAKGITVEQYIRGYDQHADTIMAELSETQLELPGASRLIDHLHFHQIPVAICTGSDAQEFAGKMAKFDKWLRKIPLRVLCGSDPDVKIGKPDPDAYQVTIGRMKPGPASPANVLVFEDSVNGVRSALAAGCKVIMVPQREFLPDNWDEKGLRSQPGFAELLNSLEQFCPEKYGLPPFANGKAK